MDQQIGRVMEKLDELGLADNTLLVFAGDNGYLWGEHRLIDKRWAYEESIRVPFIVRYPDGVKNPGSRSKDMVLNLDLAPTILDVAGLPVSETMQGKSLVPALQGSMQTLRQAWLYKYFEDYPYPVPEQVALRTERYKLIDYKRGKEDELFDLQNDPKERVNLINEPAMSGVVAELRKQLASADQGVPDSASHPLVVGDSQ